MTTLPPVPEHVEARASTLLSFVQSLGVPFGIERSFRIAQDVILPNRFLLSIAVDELPHGIIDVFRDACDKLQSPTVLQSTDSELLNAATFLHFGFEENASSCFYKLYLEQRVPKAISNPTDPVLLHVGFKWDVQNPTQHVTTHYHWHPDLTSKQIIDRVNTHFRDTHDDACSRLVFDTLSKASESAGDNPAESVMQYLEVSEDGYSRRSFDVNLYDCDAKLSDIRDQLLAMSRYYSIPRNQAATFFDQISDESLGHLAGGVHRNGQSFVNIYYGAEGVAANRLRAVQRSGSSHEHVAKIVTASRELIEWTTPNDQYLNYCLWPYEPSSSTAERYRPATLLFHSFDISKIDARAFTLVDRIRAAIGPFKTVWGVKWIDGTLGWEFYFYDYQRRDREVSISRVLDAIRPLIDCPISVNEQLPYFMFSLDVSDAMLTGEQQMDVVHMYVGNPGSTVSSGIAYAVKQNETLLENFYFFFDAKTQMDEAAEKICCSARLDPKKIDLDEVLWPELSSCQTICVANKQTTDTVYFSGVDVDQLLFFLRRMKYPEAITTFVVSNRDRLNHLLYDVGIDYIANGDELSIVKSGYYGVF